MVLHILLGKSGTLKFLSMCGVFLPFQWDNPNLLCWLLDLALYSVLCHPIFSCLVFTWTFLCKIICGIASYDPDKLVLKMLNLRVWVTGCSLYPQGIPAVWLQQSTRKQQQVILRQFRFLLNDLYSILVFLQAIFSVVCCVCHRLSKYNACKITFRAYI